MGHHLDLWEESMDFEGASNFLFLFHVENNFKGGDVLHVTATTLSASGMRGTYSLSNLISQQPCKGVYPTNCRYDKTEAQR